MDRLWRWVQTLKKDLSHGDWDSVVVVDGGEGSGKSTLALYIKAIYEECWSLDGVVFDPEDLIKQMEKAPQGSCVLFDEAILGLFKRDWQGELNRTLAKAFSIVRARNLLFILCLPNYYDLDSHLRHRCQYRWYVYVVHDKITRTRIRGHAKLYYAKKDQWMVSDPWLVEKFRYKFPAMPAGPYQVYKELKDKNISAKLGLMSKERADKKNKPKRITKRDEAIELLKSNPQISKRELAMKLNCTTDYARMLLNSIGPLEPPTKMATNE